MFFFRHRHRSPSPHSVKSSQLKNKLNDTSLFAELVKDRQKREQEIKKLESMLMEKNDECVLTTASSTTTTTTSTNSTQKNGDKSDTWTPISVDVVDIPIPSENVINVDTPPTENCVPVNNIPTPNIPVPPDNVNKDLVTTRSLTPTVSAPIPTMPPQPPVPTAPLPAPVPSVSQAMSIVNKKPLVETTKQTKPKITKLPMPPGIKQADLEVIESPPSRTPSPTPVTSAKPKTPPRKSGIMTLPMPPGTYHYKKQTQYIRIELT